MVGTFSFEARHGLGVALMISEGYRCTSLVEEMARQRLKVLNFWRNLEWHGTFFAY